MSVDDMLILTDLSNAELLIERHGEHIRYCEKFRTWFAWDGKRWIEDESKVRHFANNTARSWWSEVEDADDQELIIKHARYSEKASSIDGMIKLARPMLAITPNQLDIDPWLLNVNNGTIDLRIGKLRKHDPQNLITKLAPVDFSGMDTESPRWDAFINRITNGNHALINYLQRLSGMLMTGDVSVQEMFIFYGTGANGKSAMLDTLCSVLGDYAGQAANSLLSSAGRNEHPCELADLSGKRAVIASEIDDGVHLRVGIVKQLTGNQTIKARFMRGNFFEFPRTHKLILQTNNRPRVGENTHAIWRRIRLVPFDVTIPTDEQDPRLPEKLLAEAPGILAWMLMGCLNWQRTGLETPDEVKIATESYREEQDVIGDYLADRIIVAVNAKLPRNDLFNDYLAYCTARGDKHPLDRTSLFDRIRRIAGVGESQSRMNGIQVRCFTGLTLSYRPDLSQVTQDETGSDL